MQWGLLGFGFLILSMTGVVIGVAAEAHHIRWLDELAIAIAGTGFGFAITSFIRAWKLRRALRGDLKDLVALDKDRPEGS